MATGLMAASLTSGVTMVQGIYTCTDGKGRKITSDRPIMDCIDRNQQEITPSGTLNLSYPSFFFSSSFTCAGLALPLVAFMA